MQTRRDFLKNLTAAAFSGASHLHAAPPFRLKYLLASALYGDLPLDTILPEVKATGCAGLDIWCKPHGTQREQADAMGIEAFADLLKKHDVTPVCFTRYPLGPFGLQNEMPILKRLGGGLLVTGPSGPKNVSGTEAETAIKAFLEKMKPHADAAAEHGITIAIENHANSLLNTPDSIRSWAAQNKHPALGVAFAPHHLHEHVDEISGLIRDLGAKNLPFIYFQEHGIGSQQKVAKDIELQQLPGLGTLDYAPILRALREIGFHGWAEIFMHPTPRGVPILPTAGEITAAHNKSRTHIEKLIAAQE
jgi:sugar phosphate isomerase/epimerase